MKIDNANKGQQESGRAGISGMSMLLAALQGRMI
jgi:hypothetical protein